MTLIYIGNKKEYIDHFKKILQEDIVIVKNEEEAAIILRELPQNKVQPLLFERSDIESDKQDIAYLKMEFPYIYIILVTEQIGRKDSNTYIMAGARNTILPYADISSLNAINDFIAFNESLKSVKDETEKKIDQVYKIPHGKRIFDIVFSLLALIILSPLLILIVILIAIESRGPIIYKSKRVGSNYRVFNFFKFRSMYIDAERRLANYQDMNQYIQEKTIQNTADNIPNSDLPDKDTILISDDYKISEHDYLNKKKEKKNTTFLKISHDPRVTKIGRFIRKYSIDELPQLINILRGDMSIVGNRPLPPYEAELLTGDEYIERFIAPAGLTGLWQVEKRGNSGQMSPEERKQLDIHYAKNYSIWLDLKIILKTFISFIQKEDA